MRKKVLKVGIASAAWLKARTIAIAKGRRKRTPGEPQVWFASVHSRVPHQIVTVTAAHDKEAGVWFVESSDLSGLNGEAKTVEALLEKLPALVADLMSDSRDDPTPSPA